MIKLQKIKEIEAAENGCTMRYLDTSLCDRVKVYTEDQAEDLLIDIYRLFFKWNVGDSVKIVKK